MPNGVSLKGKFKKKTNYNWTQKLEYEILKDNITFLNFIVLNNLRTYFFWLTFEFLGHCVKCLDAIFMSDVFQFN